MGIEIFKTITLKIDGGVEKGFVEDDDDVDVFVGGVGFLGVLCFGEFGVGGADFFEFGCVVAVGG